mgnify:CR=1 FL=1
MPTTDIDHDRKRKIDISEALKLRLVKHWTYQEIGDKYGATKQAVHDALKPFNDLIKDPEAIQAYQENKANLLTSIEMELAKSMIDGGKLKDASLNNVAYAFNNVFNANRLERNQSSLNISVRTVVSDLEARKKELLESL